MNTEISCSSDNLEKVTQVLKTLTVQDKIEIIPKKGKKREFLISDEFHDGYIFIKSARKQALSTTRGGHVRVASNGVLYQPTMLTPVEWVESIRILSA